jgi:hypothetical protein
MPTVKMSRADRNPWLAKMIVLPLYFFRKIPFRKIHNIDITVFDIKKGELNLFEPFFTFVILTNMSKMYANYMPELGFFLKILGAKKGYR